MSLLLTQIGAAPPAAVWVPAAPLARFTVAPASGSVWTGFPFAAPAALSASWVPSAAAPPVAVQAVRPSFPSFPFAAAAVAPAATWVPGVATPQPAQPTAVRAAASPFPFVAPRWAPSVPPPAAQTPAPMPVQQPRAVLFGGDTPAAVPGWLLVASDPARLLRDVVTRAVPYVPPPWFAEPAAPPAAPATGGPGAVFHITSPDRDPRPFDDDDAIMALALTLT